VSFVADPLADPLPPLPPGLAHWLESKTRNQARLWNFLFPEVMLPAGDLRGECVVMGGRNVCVVMEGRNVCSNSV